MKTARPRVSIGLPVYNGARFLAEALESILSQTHTDIEVIVSDNASTDRTEDICRTYAAKDKRIQYYRNDRNVGASRNFNRVFECASGQYFKWAAADDVVAPEFLAKCVGVLDKDPTVILVYSRGVVIDEFGKILQEGTLQYDELNLRSAIVHERFRQLLHNALPYCAFTFVFGLIRSEVLRTTPLIGPYAGSDITLLADLVVRGKFAEVPEYLSCFRRHPESFSMKLLQKQQSGGMEGVAEAEWFDPANRGRIVLPNWRYFWEHFRSVVRSKADLREKMLMVDFLCRLANWRRGKLMREIEIALRQIPLRLTEWMRNVKDARDPSEGPEQGRERRGAARRG